MNFFTSDIHFGHKRMIDSRNDFVGKHRDYADMPAHDAGIMDIINSTAGVDDTIYFVGDFSFHKPHVTADILASIRAKKVLVKGNHDHRTANKMGATLPAPVMIELDEYHNYLERTFDLWEVRGGEVCVDKQMIVMFHFPIMHWHKQNLGSWHIHGHLHGNPSGVPGKALDVGWDKWGKPLNLFEVQDEMNKLPVRGNHHTEVH